MKRILSLILGLVGLLTAPAAFAQSSTHSPFQQPVYYAVDYGQWAIPSQQANTYLFSPGGLCGGVASGSQFFVFSTNAPVFIQDATPANSEVVTPSSVTNTGSQCGFSASPANNHYQFQVRSGTAGLQEAINALSTASLTYPAVVILDRNFYTQAGSIPGGVSIATVAGSTKVVLEDIVSSPNRFYSWDGSRYSSVEAPTAFFNNRVLSYTNISVPTALSTAAASAGLITTTTTGGTIPASSTYRLAATYVDASGGETLISTDSASTSTIATGSGTATNTISVTSPAAATGAVGWRLYMTAASGSAGAEILYTPTCTSTPLQTTLKGVCAIGSTATIKAIVTGTATVPLLNNAYSRSAGSSFSFPPFTAVGTVATTATGTLATINFPANYLNTLGRAFEVCGNGYATNNATPGTLTLAMKLFSVPGVTSITPWTVTSGTTTASAQIPFNFCVTYTTAATGATGTLETHGWVEFGLAGTAPGTVAQDTVFTVSSTVDLTAQDQLDITISPTTAGITAGQIRQLSIYPVN